MEYKKEEITAILTVWKRDHIEEQILSILNQTKKPNNIWIFQNESHVKINEEIKNKYNIKVIHSKDINFKFHGRFALPLLCDTEYVAIFDDDTIPGKKWFENCLRLSKEKNCIVGANGRTLINKDINSVEASGCGGGTPLEEDQEVDFVGHCWFFKAEWAKYIWFDRPATWDNGEDIHFSAACQIYSGIKSYVPKQPSRDLDFWGDIKGHYGIDEHATWRTNTHESLRSSVVKYWHNKGWKPTMSK